MTGNYSKWCLSYVEHYCSQQNQKSKSQYPSNMFAVIVASIFACPPSAVPAHRLRRSKTSALLAASGVGRAQQHAQGLFRDPSRDMLFHCVALSIVLAICNIFELEGVMSKNIGNISAFNLPTIQGSRCILALFANLFELEAAMSRVFTAFLSSNLSCSMKFAHFGARTVHVTW